MGRARAAAIVATASALALPLACGSLEPASTVGDAADAASDRTPAAPTPDAGADASASASAYRAVVLSDSPVLYYRLGERAEATVAVDQVAGKNAAYDVATGGAVGAIAGDPDTAATFDGLTARVVVSASAMPDFAANLPFTLEAWVKPRVAQPTFAHILTKESLQAGERAGYALLIDENGGFKLERFVGGANSFALFSAPPAVGAYTHVVGTYDGSTISLYLDGVRTNQTTDGAHMPAQPGVEGVIGRSSGGTFTFDGAIDEVAVYDHALPPDRVKAHHDTGIGKL